MRLECVWKHPLACACTVYTSFLLSSRGQQVQLGWRDRSGQQGELYQEVLTVDIRWDIYRGSYRTFNQELW